MLVVTPVADEAGNQVLIAVTFPERTNVFAIVAVLGTDRPFMTFRQEIVGQIPVRARDPRDPELHDELDRTNVIRAAQQSGFCPNLPSRPDVLIDMRIASNRNTGVTQLR